MYTGLNLYRWRARALAGLSSAKGTTSITLNNVPHRDELDNCDLLLVVPYHLTLHAEIRQYATAFGKKDAPEGWVPSKEPFSQHILEAIRALCTSLPPCSTRPYFNVMSENTSQPNLVYLLRPEDELTITQYEALQRELAEHIHTPAPAARTLIDLSGGLPYLQAVPRSEVDLYTERQVTFYTGLFDLRELHPAQRFTLPEDPASLLVVLQRCLQDTQLRCFQPALLPVEPLAARITQTRSDSTSEAGIAPTPQGGTTNTSGTDASYKVSITLLGDATRTATAMATSGYDLFLATALQAPNTPTFQPVGTLTLAYPFRHPAMQGGRDNRSLYERHPNALALTITLSTNACKDATPECFAPVASPPDTRVRQVNLLDITNDVMLLLTAGRLLPSSATVLDQAQLIPFTEIKNGKFVYIMVLDQTDTFPASKLQRASPLVPRLRVHPQCNSRQHLQLLIPSA
jgi:hypothetical protein